jgi:Annexin
VKQSADLNSIIEILSLRSYAQIKVINIEYKKLYGNNLEKDIKRKVNDSLKDALLAIVRTSNSPTEFYARRINKAINNFLQDDRSLGRLIVVRCEIDMMDIKTEFSRLFRKSIKSCLHNEITGSHKLALLLLLADN